MTHCRHFIGYLFGEWGCDHKLHRKDGARGKCTHHPNYEGCPNYAPILGVRR